MSDIVVDIEIIKDPKATPYIPEKGPKERTDPWEKLAFCPNFNQICVIAYCHGESGYSWGVNDYPETGEAGLLEDFWDYVESYDRIVTFSGLTFDIPFILRRSWYHGVKPTKNISLRKYTTDGNHIDVRAVLGNWDTYARGNLDLFCRLKFGEAKLEGCDGSQVQAMWDAGEYDKVHEYAKRDAELTWKLFQSLKGYYYV